jgi:hypothetical protein
VIRDYLVRAVDHIPVGRPDRSVYNIPAQIFVRAIMRAHKLIDQFKEFGIDVFSILGMRNLSAFIGELYGAAAIIESGDLFRKNPHQDGYPDLLLMDDAGTQLWEKLVGRMKEKSPFSPFRTGGIEVKATCGAVPTPEQCKKKGIEKPDQGDQRITVMRSYDWKAHHRETNNLIGIVWDFIDGVPRIVAVFYSNSLKEKDWGEIVKPRAGGGRTTSVSIMNRQGIENMYRGWLLVRKEVQYINFFDRYNRMTMLADAAKIR